MSDRLTKEGYEKQCYEDILDIVVLHSLSFSELSKLDSNLFPIEFEVWDETRRTLGVIEDRVYGKYLSDSMAKEIGEYLKGLLTIPSEKWTVSEFRENPFWEQSREKANFLKIKLNIGERGYWV